ncbi:MAG: hypothetical protein ACYC1C_19115, partial [Chloroflexota bacterium]
PEGRDAGHRNLPPTQQPDHEEWATGKGRQRKHDGEAQAHAASDRPGAAGIARRWVFSNG